MNQEDIIRMAREAGMEQDGNNFFSPMGEEMDVHISDLERFFHAAYAAGAAAEREDIAKMFDEPMHLVPFVQNHLGGCMVCGFTPTMAAATIRARGQA